MKIISRLLLAVTAMAVAQAQGSPLPLSDSVRIEPVTAISVQELWSTAQPKTATSGVVVVQTLGIDSESAATDGKWHACALMLIGTTDVGIKPVAVRLWASGSCDVSVSALSTAGDAADAAFSLKTADNQPFVIRATGNESVSISGKPIGSIGY
jgi:hypothetical protein